MTVIAAFIFVWSFLPILPIGKAWGFGDVGIVVERAAVKEGMLAEYCKYCGKEIIPGHIDANAEKIIRSKIEEVLTQRGIGYKNSIDKGPYIAVVIYRFQERRGGNYAVDKPAGAAFHMHIMEGSVVGRSFTFDEDQQPLSQNLLGIGRFFSRGGKWITVDRLARRRGRKRVELPA